MFRSLTKLFILFAFFFCFVQPAWADKIYLKNGNILEGRIVEEKKESIILEFNLENGSGNTTILNSQIKSIEKAPLADLKKEKIAAPFKQEEPLSSPKRQEDPEKEYRRTILLFSLIPAGLFVLSFVSLLLLNRIFRAEFSRPFGIKLACFYLNTANITFTLLGLMFVSLAANRVIFDFKGINLLIFYFFMLGVPFLLFILVAGLFYLKNWVRISAIILLVFGLVSAVASLAVKKNLTADFFHDFYQKATQEFSRGLPNPSQGTTSIDAFNPNEAFIFVFFCLLSIFYLFRKETRKAFSEAAQLKKPVSIDRRGIILFSIFVLITVFLGNKIYRDYWIKVYHNPYLFTAPAKAEGVIKADPFILKDLTQYNAIGYQIYLPSGMERLGVASFLERKKGIVFSISKLEESHYRILIASLYARWNPIFLWAKPSSLGEKPFPAREVKFAEKEGVLLRALDKGYDKYRFILKNDKAGYFDCLFVLKERDPSFDEKKILNIVAAIR